MPNFRFVFQNFAVSLRRFGVKMHIEELYELLSEHPQTGAVREWLRQRGDRHLLLTGLYASARAVSVAAWRQQAVVAVMSGEDEARYLHSDLKTIGANALFFPTSHRRKRRKTADVDSRLPQDEALVVQRTETLSFLANTTTDPFVLVTYPEALLESVPPKQTLTDATLSLQRGEHIQQTELVERLFCQGFERVDFVYEPGQFAVRGGIVDVYSYGHDNPYRLDFFGDEIDTIREFDIETQLSRQQVDAIRIIGQNTSDEASAATSLAGYLPPDTVWVSDDWSMVRFRMESAISGVEPLRWTFAGNVVEWRDKSSFAAYDTIAYHTEPQPLFHKNFEVLIEDLQRRVKDDYHVYILADQAKQTDRLTSIFEQMQAGITFLPVDRTLHGGWIDHDAHVVCYTDHEIFERFHRVASQNENARRGKAVVTLKEINQLRVGDYVVHSDHGIGQFGGLVTTNVNGKPQEMIRLTYRGGDTIFVSIHNLHRISKYKGKEGSAPTISRLGSGAWERLKERTKDKVKDIARDLIRLYATRKQQKGFAYLPDGYMQHELEASFLYEDTPDQAKATLEVKRDMEGPMPMDRLICGVVGFG